MARILLAAGAALCVATMAAPASAQIYGNYNDHQRYDFRTRANDGSLDSRLRVAARQWCGERMGRESLREWILVRECKREFVQEAQGQANAGAPAR